MPLQAPIAASLDDLHDAEGKAELIAGKVVPLMPTGFRPSILASRIFQAIAAFVETAKAGFALTDNVGFVVSELTSGRESFSPDAAYYLGPTPTDEMDFIPGPPDFAVEVRSKSDYGPAAESELAAKRADYFEAGTRVVWDVDPRAEVVRVYRPSDLNTAVTFGAGTSADAEPVMPGWRLDVEGVFA